MSSDRLASVVFASKNIDLDKALHDLLSSYYEANLYAGVQSEFKSRNEMDIAKDLIDTTAEHSVIDWDAVEEAIEHELNSTYSDVA